MALLKGIAVLAAALILSIHQVDGSMAGTNILGDSDDGEDSAQIYACQNEQWGEPCQTFVSKVGECTNFDTEWNDKVSSIKNLNTEGTFCAWYKHVNYQGQWYNNQEDAKLQDGNGFFNDRITSWYCIVEHNKIPSWTMI
ncbi:hypothetical protein QBC40DRAFT_257247 [Triangularia verruculosa]|uniref:Secreted protein n=1 Tax=Triangularia verruculosa TaxID=2587418 RepID=A0AAN6XAP4_9PEZI|nr:hypothetical protein QBC40DRAFT_257247 [Triangularia verruculosa]